MLSHSFESGGFVLQILPFHSLQMIFTHCKQETVREADRFIGSI